MTTRRTKAVLRRPRLMVMVMAMLVPAMFGPGQVVSGAVTRSSGQQLRGTNYFGDGLDTPTYIAGDGTNLWIANSNPETVTELSESSGKVERITPIPYALGNNPNGIAIDGSHVWVTSFYGGGLAELSKATGAVLSTITLPGLECPCDELAPLAAIADDGADVWVTEFHPPYTGTLVEVDASTGSVVQSVTLGSSSEPFQPSAVYSDGANVWVAGGSGVTEFSASNLAVVQTVSGSEDELDGASGIVGDGSHVWVTTGDAVVELSESTGSYVRSISTPALVGGASGVSSDGAHLWVATTSGIVEIAEATGGIVRDLSGPKVGIRDASAVVSNGTDVWVLDGGPGMLSELSAATGDLLHPVPDRWDLPNPFDVTAGGDQVWVLGSDGALDAGSLTVLSSSTGQQIGFIGGRGELLGQPFQVVDDGPDVWLLSGTQGNQVALTEISTTTRAALRQIVLGSDIGQPPEFALSRGRLWVLTSNPTRLLEFSASSGRSLGSFPDTVVGLPTGMTGVAATSGHLIVTGPGRLSILSGSTGQRQHTFSQSPECSYPDCSMQIIANPGSELAWFGIGPTGVLLSEYSLTSGAVVRTITTQSAGLIYPYEYSAGGALWIGGKVSNVSPTQGSVLQERRFSTGGLERTYSGGPLGLQFPGYAAVLGSQMWVPNGAGDSVTEIPLPG